MSQRLKNTRCSCPPFVGFNPVTTIGTLSIMQLDNAVALGSDLTTGERGFLVSIINDTGAASIKGSLVHASLATDRAFALQTNEFDTFGIVAVSGIAAGAPCWVWGDGSLAHVLFKDGVAPTRGYIVIAADTDGRADNIPFPGGGLPGTDTHFRECGHCVESKAPGVNVLALARCHYL